MGLLGQEGSQFADDPGRFVFTGVEVCRDVDLQKDVHDARFCNSLIMECVLSLHSPIPCCPFPATQPRQSPFRIQQKPRLRHEAHHIGGNQSRTVDGINPALPIIRIIPYSSHISGNVVFISSTVAASSIPDLQQLPS